MLSQLIYSSDVRDLGPGRIPALVEQAREINQARDLTGVLVFNAHHFLQCLEGSREQVTAAFCRIAADPRHAGVTLTSVRDVDERDFPDWSMGYLGLTAVTRQVLRRFLPNDDFAPRSMSPASATAMLKAVRSMDHALVTGLGV